MTRFQKQSSKIKIVNVKNNEAFWGNKKYALTLGIKAATNEHLLFTDADCIPSSRKWIQEMSNHFTVSKTIILADLNLMVILILFNLIIMKIY